MFASTLLQGSCERIKINKLQEIHRSQIEELITHVGKLETTQSISVENQDRYERYIAETDRNIRDVLLGQDNLQSFVEKLEDRDDVIVKRLDQVVASQDTVFITEQGETWVSGDTTYVSLDTDTLGIHLTGSISCPYGFTNIILSREPIHFIATLEETETGLKKKGIEFPDQPWIQVEEWDIVVSNKSSHTGLSSIIRNFHPILGISLREDHIGALAGARYKSIGMGLNIHTDLKPGMFMYKEF